MEATKLHMMFMMMNSAFRAMLQNEEFKNHRTEALGILDKMEVDVAALMKLRTESSKISSSFVPLYKSLPRHEKDLDQSHILCMYEFLMSAGDLETKMTETSEAIQGGKKRMGEIMQECGMDLSEVFHLL